MIWSFWDSVLLSEIEWVWICLAFKNDNTNAYFDLSEVLCPMLFLSESLGRPSGYFQAECWLLAESSLHSWTKLQPIWGDHSDLSNQGWCSWCTPSMRSKRNQFDRFVIEVQGENLRCLQKAIEVATFSRDDELIRYVVYHLCIRGWVGYWVSTYTSSRCWCVRGAAGTAIPVAAWREDFSYQITSTSHSFTTMPKSR